MEHKTPLSPRAKVLASQQQTLQQQTLTPQPLQPQLPPAPFSFSNLLCCSFYRDREELERVLIGLDLSYVQKQIILSRYINIMEHLQKRVRTYSRVFYIGHVIITVGSLFVPALLSIQNSSTLGSNFSVNIYWATFIISLLVTTFNGILTLFKIDKKYYFLNTTLERLRTEGWQYMGLTGRYSGHLTQQQLPTHQNQFVFFTHQIEKIKMKQIEEEYYKSDEKTQTPSPGSHTNNTNNTTPGHDLYPPSPDQPIASLASQVPEPVKEAVNSLIRAHTISFAKNTLTDGISNTITNTIANEDSQNVIVIPSGMNETTLQIPSYSSTLNL